MLQAVLRLCFALKVVTVCYQPERVQTVKIQPSQKRPVNGSMSRSSESLTVSFGSENVRHDTFLALT